MDFSNECKDDATDFVADFDPKDEGLTNVDVSDVSDFIGAEGGDNDCADVVGVENSFDKSSPINVFREGNGCNDASFTPPIDSDVIDDSFTPPIDTDVLDISPVSLDSDAVVYEESVRVDDATEFTEGDFPGLFECFGHNTCPVARSHVVA